MPDMSFYRDFAEYYERIFPFREETFAFLAAMLPEDARPGDAAPDPARRPFLRVLDIGCGTGHYCGRFAARGSGAVGVDLDPAMIASSRERYPNARFECLDMREIGRLAEVPAACRAEHLAEAPTGKRAEPRAGDPAGSFDLAFCIGNTLAHLPAAGLPPFLAALHDLLAPGGRWLLQVVHWDRILAAGRMDFPVLRWEGEIAFHREYRDLSEERVRFVTRLEAGGEERFSGEVDLHPIRAARYVELHEAAGLRLLGRYGDFRGAPLAPSSPALILAFERPRAAQRAFERPRAAQRAIEKG